MISLHRTPIAQCHQKLATCERGKGIRTVNKTALQLSDTQMVHFIWSDLTRTDIEPLNESHPHTNGLALASRWPDGSTLRLSYNPLDNPKGVEMLEGGPQTAGPPASIQAEKKAETIPPTFSPQSDLTCNPPPHHTTTTLWRVPSPLGHSGTQDV